MGKKLTTEQYKEQIKNKPYLVLEKYKGALTKIKHQCQVCDHIWSVSPNKINIGKGCPVCAVKRPCLTTKEYKKQIKHIPIEVLEKYKYSRTKIKHQCLKCNHIWSVTPNNIKQGSGCPICSRNQSAFDRYKNKPTWLYYIFIPSKNLYKIGLARKGTLNRWKRESFDIEIIQEELFEDGYEAYKKEQEIIQSNKHLAWFPSEEEKFGGWTECFTENIKESNESNSF